MNISQTKEETINKLLNKKHYKNLYIKHNDK